MSKPASWRQAGPEEATAKSVRHIQIVACTICDACYMPAQSRQDLWQAPPHVLENAFMSMCHFCFRCRRPACPECWDAVHSICGECVQEAHLPFRADIPHLPGMRFPPTASQMGQISADPSLTPLLICIRSGRFQQKKLLVTDAVKETPIIPAHIQEQQTGGEKDQRRHGGPQPQSRKAVPAQAERRDQTTKTRTNIFKTVERVLNVVLCVLLLFILALVMLAEFSSTANAQVIVLFHIDIRDEVAYVLSIIRQLH